MEGNVTWHHSSIAKKQRRKKNGHQSFVLWFTGLSASGKSTLANTIEKKCLNKVLPVMCWMVIISDMV